ncbi:MAG: ABC transporter ATP-binding protein [Epsilonproteobacteria bacterium]|nr:ABC transporter ATP-binding protein [Campylobacterota bacterium]
MKPILRVENLSFAYEKQTVLENINLEVFEKDFLAIIGPNGGGKSTLLKLILGINKIQSGDIKIQGKSSLQFLNKIGYVPQNTNVNTDFPIKTSEVVLMGRTSKKIFFFGYSKDEQQKAKEALEKVGMKGFANQKIGSLSGGQRQRVMIARALFTNPKILLFDEPTSSIDVAGQKKIYKLLKNLSKEITVIVVSHDLSIVLEDATKVAYINKTLVLHDALLENKKFDTKNDHFCEVELLHMLGNSHKKSCSC